MPAVNPCHHLIHPLSLKFEGTTHKIDNIKKITALCVIIGCLTLGVGGVIAFYTLTAKEKRELLQNLKQVKELKELFKQKSPALEDKLSIETAKKIIDLAVSYFSCAEGKNIANVTFHLKILKGFQKIAYKQEELIQFVKNHHKNIFRVNLHLQKETGLVFHQEMADCRNKLSLAPSDYAKAFWIAGHNNVLGDFTKQVFPANVAICLERNQASIIDWLFGSNVNSQQNIYQRMGVYYQRFYDIKERKFLKAFPEKKRLPKEEIGKDSQFIKSLTKEDFIAYLKDSKNKYLPFTPQPVKPGDPVETVTVNNVHFWVEEVNKATDMFPD